MNRREKIVLRTNGDFSGVINGQEFGCEAYIGMRIWPGLDVFSTRAFHETNLSGANNDIRFTAVKSGAAGNAPRIRYTVGAGVSTPAVITVVGNDIDITLGRDAAGVENTTAAQIIGLIQSSAAASALVTPAYKAANDGTGVVVPFSYVNLSGGADGGSVIVKLEIKNPVTGMWMDFPGAALAAITGPVTAPVMLTIFPGLVAAAGIAINHVISGGLRVTATPSAGRMNGVVCVQFIGE